MFWLLLGLAAAATAVAVATSGAGEGDVVAYVPPNAVELVSLGIPDASQAPPPADASDPQRTAVPTVQWTKREGTTRVAGMARQPRVVPSPPGYDRIDLARIATVEPVRKVRVFCDAFVLDQSIELGVYTDASHSEVRTTKYSMIRLVSLVGRTHEHAQVDSSELDPGATEQAERLVRDFLPQHDGLVGGDGYVVSETLPSNYDAPPRVPYFTGAECTTSADPPSGWRKVLDALGFEGQGGPAVTFHYDKCTGYRTASPAYPVDRTYNLRLEVRNGNEVWLTAEVARLPFTQQLDWRCYFTVQNR